MRSFEVYSSK